MSSTDTAFRLIFGANSTIGQAIAERWQGAPLLLISRDTSKLAKRFAHAHCFDFDPLAQDTRVLQSWLDQFTISQAISCVGALHGPGLAVEKSLSQLDVQQAQHSFALNALSFAKLAQALAPQLRRKQPLTLAVLSAKIGSITDNRLGGWYSYRMSKAALNMLVKDIAIEWQRKGDHKVIAIHPGTTQSPLTEPFAKNIDPNKYYDPDTTALRVIDVINHAERSGLLYHWDGQPLPF